MPTLQILSGEHEGAEFTWSSDEAFVGKDDTCEIKLDDAGVSRKHARFVKKGSGWFVEDLGSSNGTWVKFKRRNSNEAVDLEDKDIVFIGRTVAKLYFGAAPKPAASSGGVLDPAELRDLLRSVVPIHGLECPSCHANIEAELKSKIREQEQVELIRRTKLHELDQPTLERLLAQARR